MADKKQGKGKAYTTVPKGYKANWNVPKGTPWKKNSPYNPANSPAAKKAAAKKAAAKKAAEKKLAAAKPAVKKVVSKKPVVGKDGLTDYQRKISYPSKTAGNTKSKLKPYDAKWKANAIKEGKRTKLDKIAETALEFSTLGGITYAAEAVTGKSMRGPLNKPAKKVNRLGAAANAAFYLTPVGATGKIKKGIKAARETRGAGKMILDSTHSGKQQTKAVYDNYVDQLVSKEVARIRREMAKGKK